MKPLWGKRLHAALHVASATPRPVGNVSRKELVGDKSQVWRPRLGQAFILVIAFLQGRGLQIGRFRADSLRNNRGSLLPA
jgi:hypothetical protein